MRTWQIDGVVQGEIVGDVKVGVASLVAHIPRIRSTGTLVALSWTTNLLGAGVDRMGPGVGSLDLKAPGETLVQLELKPVIIGIGSTAALRPQTQWEPCVIPISPDKGRG